MSNMEENDRIVTLTDEDGNEIDFEFLDTVEYNGAEYGVFLPCDDEEGLVTILKFDSTEDDDTDSFSEVESEDVLQAVFDLFMEKNPDMADADE